MDEMGKVASERLLELINNPDSIAEQVVVPYQIIEGKHCVL
jgi:Transcriptional regulators